MISRCLFALLFGIWAAAAAADPVVVNAGEHPGFTRLRFEFGDLPEWEAKRSPLGYWLSFTTDATLEFDLSQVFRLIDRDRVSEVRAVSANEVQIDLACDCEVDVSEIGATTLIVDVRTSQAAIAETTSTQHSSIPEADLHGHPPRPAIPEPIRTPPEEHDGHYVFDPAQAMAAGELPLLIEELDGFMTHERGSAAVELVGREFSRAAAQGLVDVDPDIDARPGLHSAEGVGVLDDRANLSVKTSLDQALKPDDRALSPTEQGAVCLPDRSVDLASWADASDRLGLGRLRSEIIAEDGSIRSEGARKLARYYLALGFGSEAATVANWVEDVSERELLRSLADIIDHGKSDSDALSGQLYCEGAVALWAALSRPIPEANRPASANDILSTFSALPPHLRAHLGPLLSERLRSAGLGEEARTVVNAVTRGGENTEESTLASARLDLSGTGADAARKTLSNLSQGTDVTAAQALLELLKDAEGRGMAPNPAWVEDAPSLVRAIEGTETAEALNIAGLRGQIALGRYDSFRKAVVEGTPGLDDASRMQLAAMALASAVANADDGMFIQTEIGLSKLAPPDTLDRSTRFAMANRLLGIGLPKRSAKYLPDDRSTANELRIAAEVMVANGLAKSAVEMLAKSEEPDVAADLGDVLVAAGQDARAREVFASLGRFPDALAAAFRTGDWEWIAEGGIEDVSKATSVLLRPNTKQADTTAPNGDLLRNSQDLRDGIATLLGATELAERGAAFTN